MARMALGERRQYNAIHGSLGDVIGLLNWMWISTIVILLGAEVDAEFERSGKPEA